MNKELYNNIKYELDSLSEELATTSYVGGHLLGQKLDGKNGKDKFTIIYAFYEYMSKKESFSFINTGDWAAFFRNNFSSYLTNDVIQKDFYEIVNNDKLLDTILKVCNDNVKRDLYTYARVENSLHIKMGSNKYANIYKTIEESLIKQGAIEDPNKVDGITFTSNETSKAIDDKIEDLKKQQVNLEQEKVQRRNSMFEEASNTVGIDTGKLIKKVGKDESLDIDVIEVDPRLISKLASDAALASSMSNGFFQRLNKRVKESKKLKNVELEVVEADGKRKLVMNKKETIFDKIASSENPIIRAIYNSSKRKLELFKQLVKPSNEVNKAIKEAFVNTNQKIIASVSKTVNEVKTEYTEFNKAMHEVSKDVATEVNNKVINFANRVSDYGVQAREKAAEKLYSIADKLIDMNNARVIMRSGTKSGVINNPILLEEGTHLKSA